MNKIILRILFCLVALPPTLHAAPNDTPDVDISKPTKMLVFAVATGTIIGLILAEPTVAISILTKAGDAAIEATKSAEVIMRATVEKASIEILGPVGSILAIETIGSVVEGAKQVSNTVIEFAKDDSKIIAKSCEFLHTTATVAQTADQAVNAGLIIYRSFYPTKEQIVQDKLYQIELSQQQQAEIKKGVQSNFSQCLRIHKESIKNADGIPCRCEIQANNFILKNGHKAYAAFIKQQ